MTWAKTDPFGVEFATVALTAHRLSAVGVAIGGDTEPYRLDYAVETRRGFVTSRLRVAARGAGWRRSLDLRRSPSGRWSVAAAAAGDRPAQPPGGDAVGLADAFDCDLGLSPLTNSLPVLRLALLAGGGPIDVSAAWVSVPDLAVRRSEQRYSFLRHDADRAVVRFEEIASGFVADLTIDRDGLVLDYPGLARRLNGGETRERPAP